MCPVMAGKQVVSHMMHCWFATNNRQTDGQTQTDRQMDRRIVPSIKAPFPLHGVGPWLSNIQMDTNTNCAVVGDKDRMKQCVMKAPKTTTDHRSVSDDVTTGVTSPSLNFSPSPSSSVLIRHNKHTTTILHNSHTA